MVEQCSSVSSTGDTCVLVKGHTEPHRAVNQREWPIIAKQVRCPAITALISRSGSASTYQQCAHSIGHDGPHASAGAWPGFQFDGRLPVPGGWFLGWFTPTLTDETECGDIGPNQIGESKPRCVRPVGHEGYHESAKKAIWQDVEVRCESTDERTGARCELENGHAEMHQASVDGDMALWTSFVTLDSGEESTRCTWRHRETGVRCDYLAGHTAPHISMAFEENVSTLGWYDPSPLIPPGYGVALRGEIHRINAKLNTANREVDAQIQRAAKLEHQLENLKEASREQHAALQADLELVITQRDSNARIMERMEDDRVRLRDRIQEATRIFNKVKKLMAVSDGGDPDGVWELIQAWLGLPS